MNDTQQQAVPSLVELLTSVLPQPSSLQSQAGGAALALVMHCEIARASLPLPCLPPPAVVAEVRCRFCFPMLRCGRNLRQCGHGCRRPDAA